MNLSRFFKHLTRCPNFEIFISFAFKSEGEEIIINNYNCILQIVTMIVIYRGVLYTRASMETEKVQNPTYFLNSFLLHNKVDIIHKQLCPHTTSS